MLKKIAFLLTALALLIPLSGCANRYKRFAGWESVRIEKQVPSDNCEYKIQEACNEKASGCYNWFKKRAVTYGANTVVITDVSKSMAAKTGPAGFSAEEVTSALADYYFCPKSRPGDTKEPR